MEDLFLNEDTFHPVENSSPVPKSMDLQDSKPSHLLKPLPDETAPKLAEYLGSFPVKEATPDDRAAYVGKQLELISKRKAASLKPVCIAMTLSGVKICDPTMKEVYMSHALRRISYTTCIPNEQLLSFVSRNPGEPLTNQYCHTFKTEHATEINSIIGGAFLTAYTLKKKKKKRRLSLELATKDDFDNSISADNESNVDSISTTSIEDDVIIPKPRQTRKSSSSAAGESPEEYSPEKKNVAKSNEEKKNGFTDLETRVFAALNEKAQSNDNSQNVVMRRGVKRDSGMDRPSSRSRGSRRPLSYHDIGRSRSNNSSSSSLQQLQQFINSETVPEESALDFNISNLRINEDGEKHQTSSEDVLLNRRNKSMSLDPTARNLRPSDAYNRIREHEKRMRDNLEAQINADTMRSNAGAGGCAPSRSLTDFFPFKLGKKKKEKKKYTRSKTESVLSADRTFDRVWNPRQRVNTCDNMVFRQRTELIPTTSMLGIAESPPLSPTGEESQLFSRYAARRTNSYEMENAGSLSPTSSIDAQFSNQRIGLPRPSSTHSHLMVPRQRSSVASGTTSTAMSSCPSSTYLTDATCEDSGMYTQSSNASSSSSDSCGRRSGHSSGSDSLMSGSAAWYPHSPVNLNSSIASIESKTNAERLRQSLAAQMINTDNFVSLDAKLMSAAWYHPGIPIDVAMTILKGEEDGSFLLVRPIRKGASYTLVVSCHGSSKLFNINKIDKVGYHIEGKNQFFPHVYIMIAQYSCHPGPLPFKLKAMQMFNPLCKEKLAP